MRRPLAGPSSAAIVLTGIMFIALPAAQPDGNHASPRDPDATAPAAIPDTKTSETAADKTESTLSDASPHPTTKDGKLALARKLSKQAAEPQVDAAERVAMQTEARRLAIEAGDAALALELSDAICKAFNLDPRVLRGKTLAQLPPAAKLKIQTRLTEPAIHPISDDDILVLAHSEAFASRKSENRAQLSARFGGTRQTDRAVAAALYWLANHQSRDGSWSLQQYLKQCKDKSCTGPASQESLSAATAMALLPHLAAGQTHASAGPFQRVISRGVFWLVSHQMPDGDLSAKADSQMYSHGLATIALCEDYGLSRDRSVGTAAQKAINFIQAAQNSTTGGWRYLPGQDGDTSVLGWQFMAIKSAQMAGLQVNPAVLEGIKKWLHSVSRSDVAGGPRCQFSYQPATGARPSMTAVGLLCNQYLGLDRRDPVIVGGVDYLMANQPEPQAQNLYYWYYATQVMHNMADKDWEKWNRKIRTILVNTQSREGCAAGSWDPEKPQRDTWGGSGGRLMMTSLSALTLEVYYRYLPVYLPEIQNPAPVEKAKPDK